jgi:hypothetical protein
MKCISSRRKEAGSLRMAAPSTRAPGRVPATDDALKSRVMAPGNLALETTPLRPRPRPRPLPYLHLSLSLDAYHGLPSTHYPHKVATTHSATHTAS